MAAERLCGTQDGRRHLPTLCLGENLDDLFLAESAFLYALLRLSFARIPALSCPGFVVTSVNKRFAVAFAKSSRQNAARHMISLRAAATIRLQWSDRHGSMVA